MRASDSLSKGRERGSRRAGAEQHTHLVEHESDGVRVSACLAARTGLTAVVARLSRAPLACARRRLLARSGLNRALLTLCRSAQPKRRYLFRGSGGWHRVCFQSQVMPLLLLARRVLHGERRGDEALGLRGRVEACAQPSHATRAAHGSRRGAVLVHVHLQGVRDGGFAQGRGLGEDAGGAQRLWRQPVLLDALRGARQVAQHEAGQRGREPRGCGTERVASDERTGAAVCGAGRGVLVHAQGGRGGVGQRAACGGGRGRLGWKRLHALRRASCEGPGQGCKGLGGGSGKARNRPPPNPSSLTCRTRGCRRRAR